MIVAGTNYNSHGLTISDDGTRAYVAASQGLFILDTSEIQARKQGAQFKEISKLDWPERTIPQVAQPITIAGRPYLAEIDEFSSAENDDSVASNGPKVGAARIIDIGDERNPKVVSNIRLAVHQRENRAKIAGDPGAGLIVQGYAGHYCTVPRRTDPEILACSMIASGLRIFDIRDPLKPREMAYYVAPNKTSQTAGAPSNYAMSGPAFAPERSEVWYTDGNSGFYDVKLAGWPFPASGSAGAASGDCTGDAGFRSVSAKPRGRRVRFGFTRKRSGAVKIEVFQVSQGRRIIKERRVARFTKPATWKGRVPDGYYFARFTMAGKDVRRIVLRKRNGTFQRVARHYRRGDCELLRSYKLQRPVFGGRQGTPLRVAFRLTRAAPVRLALIRGKRVVARRKVDAAAGRTYRLRLRPRNRGVYRMRLSAGSVTATLTARRL